MKNQEIIFKCRHCNNNIYYNQSQCRICGVSIEWDDSVDLIYTDKYLEIYEVQV